VGACGGYGLGGALASSLALSQRSHLGRAHTVQARKRWRHAEETGKAVLAARAYRGYSKLRTRTTTREGPMLLGIALL
jgi:hypothetical protein